MTKSTSSLFEAKSLTDFQSDDTEEILLYLNFLNEKRVSKFFIGLFGIGFPKWMEGYIYCRNLKADSSF